jgi:outer membrane protein TolC
MIARLTLVPAFGALLLSAPALAQPTSPQPGSSSPPVTEGSAPAALAEHDALRLAMAQSPRLRAALIDMQRARASVGAEEDRYPLMLQLDAGANHLRNVGLASDTSGAPTTQISTTDSVILGSELRKAFSFGTSVAFRVEGSWTRRAFPILPNSPVELTLGPGYALSARLSVVQPLLRGFGDDVGETELRQAQLGQKSAAASGDRVASELLRDVLTAYWELWYGGEAVAIEERARTLAKTELENAEARVESGVVPPVEIHSFITNVATREEAVLLAELDREQRALQLGLLLGQPGKGARNLEAVAESAPDPGSLPQVDVLIDQAVAASPELAELDAQVAAARDRERVAGEPDRQRLDLEGWLQTQGLGNESVPPALEQFGTFGVFSAHVGLVYELPLTGSRYDSQKEAAHLATEAAEQQREVTRQRIESEIRQLHQQARAAERRVALARRTLQAAEAQLVGARDKYELGNGLSVDIERAEDALRQARLREVRARVDDVVARLSLDHLTGRLLSRYAKFVKELRAEGPEGMTPPAPRGPF